jgi:hypothetical protein
MSRKYPITLSALLNGIHQEEVYRITTLVRVQEFAIHSFTRSSREVVSPLTVELEETIGHDSPLVRMNNTCKNGEGG